MMRGIMRNLRLSILLAVAVACGTAAAESPDLLDLPLGDPARRDRTVPLVLDAVTDAHTGDLLDPGAIAGRLAGARLVFVGESHTTPEFHAVQLEVIRALERAGRRVAIGLEMFPATDQEVLDAWSAGLLTEKGFLERSAWYDRWGYPWAYYRDIFLYAREHGLPMAGLNTPRDTVRAVSRGGLENLPEDAEYLPPDVDADDPEHMRLFRSWFEGEDFHASMSEERWQRMFEAQCTWDATMGHNALRALERLADDPAAAVVVLAGVGHLAYGLGIQRQAARWYDGPTATVLPVHVGGPCDEDPETVRASYADLVWGVPPPSAPPYPHLGTSETADEESGLRRVVHVDERSPAAAAGVEVGDLLVSLAGVAIVDRAALNRTIAERRWGETVPLVLRRGDAEITLDVAFRRSRPEPCEDGDEGETEGDPAQQAPAH